MFAAASNPLERVPSVYPSLLAGFPGYEPTRTLYIDRNDVKSKFSSLECEQLDEKRFVQWLKKLRIAVCRYPTMVEMLQADGTALEMPDYRTLIQAYNGDKVLDDFQSRAID